MAERATNTRRSRFDLKPEVIVVQPPVLEQQEVSQHVEKSNNVTVAFTDAEETLPPIASTNGVIDSFQKEAIFTEIKDSREQHIPESHEQSTKVENDATPSITLSNESSINNDGGRRKRSRWAETTDTQSNNDPINATLPSNMSKTEQQLYVVQLRIEELTQKLRTGDIIPPDGRRSPSPEPEYDTNGKRLNTREVRYRKRLEEERHRLVEEATRLDPLFRPPSDYRRPTRVSEKLYLPVKEFPEFNFVGLLIGPRGSTLKKLESETGAKVSIRGKGASKEGKVQENMSTFNENEDLHCYVVADSDEKVRKTIKAIKKIVHDSTTSPDELNEMKKQQLRELAILNGTYRGEDHIPCHTCGLTGHKTQFCPDKRNFTQQQVCQICQGIGHLSRDCRMKQDRPYSQFPPPPPPSNASIQLDDEYRQLMAQLGESSTTENVTKKGDTPKTDSPPPTIESSHKESPILPPVDNSSHHGMPPNMNPPPPPPPHHHQPSNYPNNNNNPNQQHRQYNQYGRPPPPPPPQQRPPFQSQQMYHPPPPPQMQQHNQYNYDYQQYYLQCQQYAQYYGYPYDPNAYAASAGGTGGAYMNPYQPPQPHSQLQPPQLPSTTEDSKPNL